MLLTAYFYIKIVPLLTRRISRYKMLVSTNKRRDIVKDVLVQSILEATKKLIIHRGYTATTTKRIAQEAKISEMSLFRTFKKKKDIVLYALEHHLWFPAFSAIDTTPTTEPLDVQLTRLAESFCTYISEDYIRLLIGLRSPDIFPELREKLTMVQPFRANLSDFFAAYSDKPEIYAEIFMSVFFGWLFAQISYEDNFYQSSFAEFSQTIIQLLETQLKHH